MTMDEMGTGENHGPCEFPGCPEAAVETIYCLNDQAPPPLLCASLCGAHMGECPEATPEAQAWIHALRAVEREEWEQHVD